MPLLNSSALFPVVLPDGKAIENTVYLKNAINHPRMDIGDYSYASNFSIPKDWAAELAPYLFAFSREKLTIGKFVQIAHGVRFITSSANHPMDGLSTYPFRIFKPGTMGDYDRLPVKDTVIGHDVWIGCSAIIMPGVSIGSGAIIAAGAVVTRDVKPYTIVGGNPAMPIRKRFSDPVIADLLDLAWWDWPIDRIEASLKAIETGDLDALKANRPD